MCTLREQRCTLLLNKKSDTNQFHMAGIQKAAATRLTHHQTLVVEPSVYNNSFIFKWLGKIGLHVNKCTSRFFV